MCNKAAHRVQAIPPVDQVSCVYFVLYIACNRVSFLLFLNMTPKGFDVVIANQQKMLGVLKQIQLDQAAMMKTQEGIKSAIKELQVLTKETEKKMFKVKESLYEVSK